MKTVHSNEPSPFTKEEIFTKGEQFVLDWQYRTARGFGRILAELFMLADSKNTKALEIAFPEEAAAMSNYMNSPGWWQNLQRRYLEQRG